MSWAPQKMRKCCCLTWGEFAGGSPAASLKTTSRGAAPHAGHFLCAAKESNQRNAAPLRQPAASFGWMNPSGGCATRLGGAHKTCPTAELKQCSPKTPDGFIQSQWRKRGRKSKDPKPLVFRVDNSLPTLSSYHATKLDLTIAYTEFATMYGQHRHHVFDLQSGFI